ncbi:hypothetical protein PVAND_004763 [Polypedilum vanderplanki]|uniref:Uncharacterized protein n=1 Tax=Polypedilum vanderplanki TaxID=319348 RepID=A0A9J6BYQ8_POLVA|nr:hypothetical protein PVAND_004763 [Polypedilum vanderplanki]
MKFQIFISFLVLFVLIAKNYALVQDTHDKNTEIERTKAISDIESLLKDLINPGNFQKDGDLKDMKRFSVVNDIDGVNVNTDIHGTEINHINEIKPSRNSYDLLNSFGELLGNMNDENSNKDSIAFHQHTEDAIVKLKSLVKSLARCQNISESLLKNEVKSQKDLNVVRRRMANELQKAREITKRIAPNDPNGIGKDTKNLLNHLGRSLRQALITSTKLSPKNIETKKDLMVINDKLEDEIDIAMEISQKLAKKLENGKENNEKMEDEKDIDLSSDDENEKIESDIIKTIEKAIEIANKVDDKTLRKFAMKNKIRGKNVNANQNFNEMNFRNSPTAARLESSLQMRTYDSADRLYPVGQPRYFFDENEEKQTLDEDFSKVGTSGRKFSKIYDPHEDGCRSGDCILHDDFSLEQDKDNLKNEEKQTLDLIPKSIDFPEYVQNIKNPSKIESRDEIDPGFDRCSFGRCRITPYQQDKDLLKDEDEDEKKKKIFNSLWKDRNNKFGSLGEFGPGAGLYQQDIDHFKDEIPME